MSKVVVIQLLRRGNEPFPGYNASVIDVNVALEAAVATAGENVYFWKHRGMWNCGLDIFTADGFHLSPEIGYPKYVRSVRDCIIRVRSW